MESNIILLWALVVALLLTSGYRYGTFLEIYVHNLNIGTARTSLNLEVGTPEVPNFPYP